MEREPPVEAWGLLIKGCQAVVLLATTYLLLHHLGGSTVETEASKGDPA